jgi:hypothetical protein
MKCINCAVELQQTEEFFKIVKMKRAKWNFSFGYAPGVSGSLGIVTPGGLQPSHTSSIAWNQKTEPVHMESDDVKNFCAECFQVMAGKEFM